MTLITEGVNYKHMNNIESIHQNNLDRERILANDLSVIKNHFGKGDEHLPLYEKETIERIEKNKGEIGGRTALVAEFILRKHVRGLKERNNEIKRVFNSAENFNRNDLDAELDANNEEINMIESNCLQTLGEINTNL